jgi:predicted phage terminase large subunit-like protein
MGTTCFEREMQNNVRDDATSIIKESWIRYFNGDIPANEEVTRCIGALDPAVSEKQLADYSAKCIGYYCKSGNKYIVDIKEEHLTLNDNLNDCKMLHSKYSFDLFKIEEIAAFQFIGQELKRLTSIPVKSFKKVKDKITRLENVSPQFENGKIFISSKIDKRILDRAVEQLINNFPSNDDIRDSIVLFCEEDNKPNFFAGAA